MDISMTAVRAPGVECPERTLSEIQLQNLVLEAINKVLGGKQRAFKVLETNISDVVGNAHIEELEHASNSRLKNSRRFL